MLGFGLDCACCHNCPAVSWKSFPYSHHCLWLSQSSWTSSTMIPKPWEEQVWERCSFRAEHSLVSIPCTLLDQLWVSVLVTVYCKKTLVWWGWETHQSIGIRMGRSESGYSSKLLILGLQPKGHYEGLKTYRIPLKCYGLQNRKANTTLLLSVVRHLSSRVAVTSRIMVSIWHKLVP